MFAPFSAYPHSVLVSHHATISSDPGRRALEASEIKGFENDNNDLLLVAACDAKNLLVIVAWSLVQTEMVANWT